MIEATTSVPEVPLSPLQSPVAVHDVTLVDDQVKVVLPPAITVVGLAERLADGAAGAGGDGVGAGGGGVGGADEVSPPPPQAAARSNSASSERQRLATTNALPKDSRTPFFPNAQRMIRAPRSTAMSLYPRVVAIHPWERQPSGALQPIRVSRCDGDLRSFQRGAARITTRRCEASPSST
jgi:hypothetical protein